MNIFKCGIIHARVDPKLRGDPAARGTNSNRARTKVEVAIVTTVFASYTTWEGREIEIYTQENCNNNSVGIFIHVLMNKYYL